MHGMSPVKSRAKPLAKSLAETCDLSRSGCWLSPREASAYLNTRWGIRRGPTRLAQLRCKGAGPVYVKFEREVYYIHASLDEWVLSRAKLCTHTAVETGM
jgi:hypothetical protein